MRKAADLTGDFTDPDQHHGLLPGEAVPNFELSDRKKHTEVVDLQSAKVLIMLVDEIERRQASLPLACSSRVVLTPACAGRARVTPKRIRRRHVTAPITS